MGRVSNSDRITARDERIRQLEELNKTLAAEVDRMRPLCDEAQKTLVGINRLYGDILWSVPLRDAVRDFQASKPK